MNLSHLTAEELLRFVSATGADRRDPLLGALTARLAETVARANPNDNEVALARQEGFDEGFGKGQEGDRDWQYALRMVREVVVDIENTCSGSPPAALSKLDSLLEHAEVCGSLDEWQEAVEPFMDQPRDASDPPTKPRLKGQPNRKRQPRQKLLLGKLPIGKSIQRDKARDLLRGDGASDRVAWNTIDQLIKKGNLEESSDGMLTRVS